MVEQPRNEIVLFKMEIVIEVA